MADGVAVSVATQCRCTMQVAMQMYAWAKKCTTAQPMMQDVYDARVFSAQCLLVPRGEHYPTQTACMLKPGL